MRRWTRLLASVIVLALLHAAAPAAEAPPVGVLVESLGAPDFARREAAQAALLAVGPTEPVLAALRAAAAASMDAEVRLRAATILNRLTRYSEGAKLLTSRTVALKFDAVPLDKAVAALAKQTGTNLKLAAGKVAVPTRPVSVTTGELSAWEAVEAFRAAAGLVEEFREDAPPPEKVPGIPYPAVRVSYYNGMPQGPEVTANLVPVLWVDAPANRPSASLATDCTGPVRVSALPGRFPQNRIIRGVGHVLIHLDIAPPADLRWERTDEIRLTHAEDETTRPITIAHAAPSPTVYDESFGGFGGFGGFAFNNYSNIAPVARGNPRLAPLLLKTDDRLIHTLRVLEGVVLGTVSLPNQPVFTVENLATATGKTLEGPNDTKLTVQSFTTTEKNAATLQLIVEGPNPWAQARLGNRVAPISLWDDGGLAHTGLKSYRFTDAAGKPVEDALDFLQLLGQRRPPDKHDAVAIPAVADGQFATRPHGDRW